MAISQDGAVPHGFRFDATEAAALTSTSREARGAESARISFPSS